jgi:hypothetical protein
MTIDLVYLHNNLGEESHDGFQLFLAPRCAEDLKGRRAQARLRRLCMYVCMYVCMCVCVCVCVYMYVCMHEFKYVHTCYVLIQPPIAYIASSSPLCLLRVCTS